MTTFATAVLRDSYRLNSEDHVEIRRFGDRVLIALADGAGGRPNGGPSAELAVRAILERQPSLDPADWVACLAEIDRRIEAGGGGGETTAVAVVVASDTIVGASVGDSGAWFVRDGECVDLTQRQQRKPCLGSGVAIPRMFRTGPGPGTLLVASDGLLKYTSREKIEQTLRQAAIDTAPRLLVDLVRLRSGALQDDVAIALCRRE